MFCVYMFVRACAPTQRMPQKSVNNKHSRVLTGIIRFKSASQFVECYHNVVNYAMNIEYRISNNLLKFIEQYISF
jgi:hypothetical protein